MDDALLVRRFQRCGDLPGDCQGVGHWQAGLSPGARALSQFFSERRALDELHHEGWHSVEFFEPMDRCDMGMIQCCEQTGLAPESREPIRVRGEDRREDLDRDVATQLRIARAIDFAHAARTQEGLNLIYADSMAIEPRRHSPFR